MFFGDTKSTSMSMKCETLCGNLKSSCKRKNTFVLPVCCKWLCLAAHGWHYLPISCSTYTNLVTNILFHLQNDFHRHVLSGGKGSYAFLPGSLTLFPNLHVEGGGLTGNLLKRKFFSGIPSLRGIIRPSHPIRPILTRHKDRKAIGIIAFLLRAG